MQNPRRLDDSTLVQQVLRGEREVYGELVRRHLPAVHAIAYAKLGNHAEAEDVGQDAFVSALVKLDQLRKPAHFGAWVAGIGRNLALDRLRKAARQGRARERLAHETETVASATDPARRETHDIVREQLNRLREDYREILFLQHFADMSTPDIARVLNLRPATVRKRLQRAREMLGQRVLAATGNDEELRTRFRKGHTRIASIALTTPVPWLSRKAPTAAPHRPARLRNGLLAMGVVAVVIVAVLAFLNRAEDRSGTMPSEPALEAAAPESRPTTPPLASRQPGVIPAEGSAAPARNEEALAEIEPVGGTIRGRVIGEESGTGLGDQIVRVTAVETEPAWSNDTRTDAEGHFALGGLQPGFYDVQLLSVPRDYPSMARPDKPTRVHLSDSMQAEHVEISLRRGLTIRGWLLDPNGDPVGGKSVGSEALNSPRSDNKSTNADGAFAVTGYEAGDIVVLRGEAPGFAMPYSEPFHLENEDITDVRLQLMPEATVAGRLTDLRGAAVSGKVVWLSAGGPGVSVRARSEPTTALGHFTVTGLPPGTYTVGLASSEPEWEAVPVSPTKVALERAEALRNLIVVVDMSPDQRVADQRIAGRVVDQNANPIAEARLDCYGPSSTPTIRSGPDGSFAFTNLKPGSYQMCVIGDDRYGRKWLMVTAGTKDVEVVLTHGGSIAGKVIDAETREPVTRFELLDTSADIKYWKPFESANGTFLLENVRPGECVLKVRRPGCAPVASDPIPVLTGETTADVTIALDEGRTIVGKILDTDNLPVRDAKVFLNRLPISMNGWNRGVGFAAVSGPSGTFVLCGVTEDVRQLPVYHSDHGPATLDLASVSGDEVTVRMPRGAIISGRIATGDMPVSGVNVQLGESYPPLWGAKSDVNGHYALKCVPTGTSEVRFRKTVDLDGSSPCYWSARVRTDILDGQTTPLDIGIGGWDTEVRGLITENGLPANAGQPVSFEYVRSGERERYSVRTNATGAYWLTGLPPGRAIMDVSSAALVTILEGAVTELDVDVPYEDQADSR